MRSSREEILARLKNDRKIRTKNTGFKFPLFQNEGTSPELLFKKKLEEVNGKAELFETAEDCCRFLKESLAEYSSSAICCNEPAIQSILDTNEVPYTHCSLIPETIEVSITGCESLIAATGSAFVSSRQKGARKMFVYPPHHIILANRKQIVMNLEEAIEALLKKYPEELPSQLLLITGPSRTADIEKILTLGAHGPKQLHVYLF